MIAMPPDHLPNVGLGRSSADILVSMAKACAELVGAREVAPAKADIRKMIGWYGDHAAPCIERAIMDRRAEKQTQKS